MSDRFPFRDRLSGQYQMLQAPSRAVARVVYENTVLRWAVRRHRITHAYTFFGPGLPHFKNVRQVVGVAYPTLVYDDSPYWRHLRKAFKWRKRIQNKLRKMRIRQADHLIFETAVMQSRAREVALVSKGSSILPPTPTKYLSPMPLSVDCEMRVLFLSGVDPHKNLWRIIDVLPLLADANLPVRFLVSVHRSEFLRYLPYTVSESVEALVERYIEFLGPLPPDKLMEAYGRSTIVANLSDLESFSNNYCEAWLVGRPILASDRDFARHICGASAHYVEPHDPHSVFCGLKMLFEDRGVFEFMIQEGRSRLAKLPNIDQRVAALKGVIFSE